MTTLFISDLHLTSERPAIARAFLDLLHNEAPKAEALYILGDLFEAWLGDDAMGPPHEPILQAFRALTGTGVPVYFVHGNRDFLVGETFAERSGCTLLPEAQVIDLYGTPTLLMHGDTLCIDDVDYQRFRAMVRNPEWQQQMLALPIDERIRLAREYRDASQTETAQKADDIMDANEGAVSQALSEHGVRHLIHGHTHRPAIHRLSVDNQPGARIVLGDWCDQPSVLYCDPNGCRLADPRVTDNEYAFPG